MCIVSLPMRRQGAASDKEANFPWPESRSLRPTPATTLGGGDANSIVVRPLLLT